jgi:hypothetical protein
MSIATYAELKTAVGNWLEDDELTDRIPEFIALGEASIARDVRCRDMEKRATTTITTEYVEIPDDYISIRNIQLNTDPVRDLEYLTPETLDRMTSHSGTGEPKWFTIIGREFQFRPVPTSYEVEIAYTARFAAFSDDADTNWLLENHPGIYLYGTLTAAGIYRRDEEGLRTYAIAYDSEVKELNDAQKRGQFGETLTARPLSSTP